jgi:hypothetical protein
MERKKLAAGPHAATSSSSERRTVGPLMRMNAPSVPTIEYHGGKGMKQGGVTGILCLLAAK